MAYQYKALAEYILQLADEQCIKDINQMKLQKLLYFIEGLHLGRCGKPLLDSEFVAWKHGPVIESLYQDLKQYKAKTLKKGMLRENPTKIDPQDKENIRIYFDAFKDTTPWELRELSHRIGPWKDIYVPYIAGLVIPQHMMEEQFKQFLDSL